MKNKQQLENLKQVQGKENLKETPPDCFAIDLPIKLLGLGEIEENMVKLAQKSAEFVGD